MDILFEDAHVLIVRKEAGLPVQSRNIGTKDLVSCLKNRLFTGNDQKREPYIGTVHRIDQPVEGLLVFAKTQFAAAELSRQLTHKKIEKYYLAVVCGVPRKKETLIDFLVKDGRNNISKVVKENTPQAKKAVLHYQVLETIEAEEDQISLVEVELETGRHHQIRVQMANAGFPLYGDAKYNKINEKNNDKDNIVSNVRGINVALCAYKLAFNHPKTKKKISFAMEPSQDIFKKFGEIGN